MAIKTQSIEIQTPGGRMPAHLAEPEGAGPFPAVVVIMEAFGLLPNIERIAERIAAEGYVAVAPDFYFRVLPDKNKFGYDDLPGAIAVMSALDDADFVGDMRATVAMLKGRANASGKVGVTGFCMGGRLSFLSACEGLVDCAAPFYGGGITGHLPQAANIAAPLHLFFGEKDGFIPVEQVHEIEAKLSELGKTFELDLYAGADHGFFCDERESYNEAAASDSWEKLKKFLSASL